MGFYRSVAAGLVATVLYTLPTPMVSAQPINDDIANAELITSKTARRTIADTSMYTMESGERDHDNGPTRNGRSAWWKWVAPDNGNYALFSSRSDGHTVAAVYLSLNANPNVRSLTQIAGSAYDLTGTRDGAVAFTAVKDETYYFAIAARDESATDTGEYRMELRDLSGTTRTDGLVASVLPLARAVKITDPATAFATVINTGMDRALNCFIRLPSKRLGASMFFYQATDASNQLVGNPNQPVTIQAGAAQNFLFGVAPGAELRTAIEIDPVFECSNRNPAPVVTGLNTLLLSSGRTTPADMVSISATLNNDGIVNVPGPTGTGVFSVATVNNGGVDRGITVSVDTGMTTLPVSFLVCQTDASGACLSPPANEVLFVARRNQPATFSIFAIGSGTIPFDPAVNRVFVRFDDQVTTTELTTRGATSVAIRTQ